MFGCSSLFGMYFILSIIVIIFLMFQINENFNNGRDCRMKDQEQVTKAAKLLVQSATQSHVLFAYEHSLESKFILDNIINQQGGVVLAEKNLKLPKGDLDKLKTNVSKQHQKMQDYLMTEIIKVFPQFETEINDQAGLNTTIDDSKRRTKHHTRH